MFTFHTAHAQNSDTEMQKISEWGQEYADITAIITSLYDIEKINTVLQSLENNENDTTFDTAYGIWSDDIEKKIIQLKNKSSNLSDPPVLIDLIDLSPIFMEQKANITPLVEASIESVTHLQSAFQRIRNGDRSGITEILIAQQTANKHVFESNNLVTKIALYTLDKSHPNYYVQVISLADANYHLLEIELTILELRGKSTLKARTPILQKMRKHLEKYEAAIPKGMVAVEDLIAYFQNDSGQHPEDKNQNDNLIRGFSTFNDTFACEAKIIKVLQKSLSLYERSVSTENSYELIRLNEVKYVELRQLSVAIYIDRINILSNAVK